MNWRRGMLILLVMTLCVQVHGAVERSGWTCFLVRHAEKTSDEGDPPLSEAGQRRARTLADMLRPFGVSHIWTSDALRARATAAPLAARASIQVRVWPGREAERFASAVRQLPDGSVGLVVGHSNTVPEILKALGVIPVPTIAETEFDRLFVVTQERAGPVRWVELKYTAPAASEL